MTSKRLNPWSIVAILCAVGLCPLFSIAAILAGARALVEIKARNDTTGVRLAWISICLGALITGLWGGGMLWWNTNVRSMIEQGPIHAIIEGQSGDVEAFTALFVQDTTPELFGFQVIPRGVALLVAGPVGAADELHEGRHRGGAVGGDRAVQHHPPVIPRVGPPGVLVGFGSIILLDGDHCVSPFTYLVYF